MRISFITSDRYLFRYAELMLKEKATVIMDFDPSADIIIYDCESGLELPPTSMHVVKISRNEIADTISIPLPHTFFKELISTTKQRAHLSLSSDGKHAFVKEKTVKLTAHEFSLLSLLIDGGDNYTTREEIAKKIWGEASDGLINIYIHYLREKLETGGEKIIVCSRKYGYKINNAYLKSQSSSEKGDIL